MAVITADYLMMDIRKGLEVALPSPIRDQALELVRLSLIVAYQNGRREQIYRGGLGRE